MNWLVLNISYPNRFTDLRIKVTPLEYSEVKTFLKFSDGDGPNLCRVKRVDVCSTFIENTFRPGLTFVSSNDIITIKIDQKCKKSKDKQTKEIIQNKNLDCQVDIRETNSDYEMEKR